MPGGSLTITMNPTLGLVNPVLGDNIKCVNESDIENPFIEANDAKSAEDKNKSEGANNLSENNSVERSYLSNQKFAAQLASLTSRAQAKGSEMPVGFANFEEKTSIFNNILSEEDINKVKSLTIEIEGVFNTVSEMNANDIRSELNKGYVEFNYQCEGEEKIFAAQRIKVNFETTIFGMLLEKFELLDELLIKACEKDKGEHAEIDELQENYALLGAQFRGIVMSCVDANCQGKLFEGTIKDAMVSAQKRMDGSIGAMNEIHQVIDPILARLDAATSKGAETQMVNIEDLAKEANDAISLLELVRDKGIALDETSRDTYNGKTVAEMKDILSQDLENAESRVAPARSEINVLIDLLKLRVGNLTEKLNTGLDEMTTDMKSHEFVTENIKNFLQCENAFDIVKNTYVVGLGSDNKNWVRKAFELCQSSDFDHEMKKEDEENVIKHIFEAYIDVFGYNKLPDNQASCLSQFASVFKKLTEVIETKTTVRDISGRTKKEFQISEEFKDVCKKCVYALDKLADDYRDDGFLEKKTNDLGVLESLRDGEKVAQLRAKDYEALMNGNVDLASLTYAYAQGLTGDHIMPNFNSANIISDKELDKGNFNSVRKCEYNVLDKNGSSCVQVGVFKEEYDARYGLEHGVSRFLKYDKTQLVLQNNVATKTIATALGCADIIPSCGLAVVNGRPGIMMDMAEGVPARVFENLQSKIYGDDKAKGVASKYITILRDFCDLPDDDRDRMVGDLMRQLNDLHWIDLLSAQADRHAGNYLVNIDNASKKITVIGIDNDMSFGKNMVGMRTLRISEEGYNNIFNDKKYPVEHPMDGLLSGNTYEVDENGKKTGYILCNTRNLPPDAHHALLYKGFTEFALPSVIDANTYEKLMSIDVEEYRKKMLEILQDKDSADAAVNRLKDLKVHAKELANNGNKIESALWCRRDEQTRIGQLQMSTVEEKLTEGKKVAFPKTENKIDADAFNMDHVKTNSAKTKKGYEKEFKVYPWFRYGESFVRDMSFMYELAKKRSAKKKP